jgi:hypothetical protein
MKQFTKKFLMSNFSYNEHNLRKKSYILDKGKTIDTQIRILYKWIV